MISCFVSKKMLYMLIIIVFLDNKQTVFTFCKTEKLDGDSGKST